MTGLMTQTAGNTGAGLLKRVAKVPFRFMTASYLIRIHNQTAENLVELLAGIDQATDASIFCHTFQTLGEHHFLTEGFSNDFAQWVLASLNRPVLAEWLGGIDIRDYVSLAAIRDDLKRLIASYCEAFPRQAEIAAFEPFYFSESIEVTEPLGIEAVTLAEFRDCFASLSHSSLYYHLIFSRIRLHLSTNDFSEWLSGCLGLDDLARRINRADIYTDTLEGIREAVLGWIDKDLAL
jgi:hypothetical protein